jgi:putative ABC transport system permease protein
MPSGVGGVVADSGAEFTIVGEIATPSALTMLEPLLLIPQAVDNLSIAPVMLLMVTAARPDLVAPLSDAVQSLLAVDDPSKITVATSESLAELRALIEGQLGSFGRNLVVLVFAITAVLVAAILYGLVMLRRKDFGRRRALGASRGLIISLLLSQMAILGAIGAVLGSGVAAVGLTITGDPLPGLEFFVAVSVLAVAVSVGAALLPAIAASRRDPLKELRVP